VTNVEVLAPPWQPAEPAILAAWAVPGPLPILNARLVQGAGATPRPLPTYPKSQEKMDQAKALTKCLTPAGVEFLQRRDLTDQMSTWTRMIDTRPGLPDDIARAMLPNNPGYRGSQRPDGPLAWIIAAIVMEVTGETVSPDAVGAQLGKRHYFGK
jgi:hypothetical protein